MGVDFERTDRVLSELEASRDLDDKACAIYLRALEAEMRSAIYNEVPETVEFRNRHLKRMLGFAKAHAKYGARFADLEIEARMRRVRVLFDTGEKTAAISEARRTSKLLEARAGAQSPTLDFVKGVMFGALGQANFLARTALWAAGISGSPEEGNRSMQRLMAGDSVYKHEAYCIAYYFALTRTEEGENSPLGSPTVIARFLAVKNPENPQFAYEYARMLYRNDQCGQAIEVVQPWVDQLSSDSDAWTQSIRAKTYYIASACNLAEGHVKKAVAFRDRFAAENFKDFAKLLSELSTKVDKAASQLGSIEASRETEVPGG